MTVIQAEFIQCNSSIVYPIELIELVELIEVIERIALMQVLNLEKTELLSTVN